MEIEEIINMLEEIEKSLAVSIESAIDKVNLYKNNIEKKLK